MTGHAVEEMAKDRLTIHDVEHAVLSGHIATIQRGEPRGTRYVVIGSARGRRARVAVVGRFGTDGRYIIITVYALEH